MPVDACIPKNIVPAIIELDEFVRKRRFTKFRKCKVGWVWNGDGSRRSWGEEGEDYQNTVFVILQKCSRIKHI